MKRRRRSVLYSDGVLAVVLVALAILVVALIPLPAHGQSAPATSWPDCLPLEADGAGTEYRVFETAEVIGRIGWCPTGDGRWYLYVHQFCLRSVCERAPILLTKSILGALDRVAAADDKLAQVKLEWALFGIPVESPLDRWHVRNWKKQACQYMTSTQPGVTPRPPLPVKLPDDVANDDGTKPWAPPITWCDYINVGDRPAPPAAAYVVTGNSAYPVLPDGSRSSMPIAQAPLKGAPCDCAAKQLLVTVVGVQVRYCAVQIPNVTQLVVASCGVKK